MHIHRLLRPRRRPDYGSPIMSPSPRPGRRAFTLTELLMVIALIWVNPKTHIVYAIAGLGVAETDLLGVANGVATAPASIRLLMSVLW